MATTIGRFVLCDTPKAGVRVIRFLCPDNRDHLYDTAEIADCALYQDLHATALAGVTPDQVVVFNFALVEHYNSAFHRLMHQAGQVIEPDAKRRKARVVVCNMTPYVRQGFELMSGDKQFDTAVSEERAVKAGG